MGGEIQRRVPAAAHGLWSANALLDHPQMVVNIHREYIDAGAIIITTNTYSTVPSYLGKADLAERYPELTALAARLARQAVAESGASEVLVAGALPPLSESYRADLVPEADEALPIYENMVKAMVADVDLFVCETMSSADEARHAASQALAFGEGKPVYVSWTLSETPGDGLRSEETIAEAFSRLSDLSIDAFLFNCTHPEAIEVGIGELAQLTDKPIGCYPNRLNRVPEGWTLDNEATTGLRSDLPEDVYVASMLRCIEQGASIVGGCCGIGPADIRALVERLAERGVYASNSSQCKTGTSSASAKCV